MIKKATRIAIALVLALGLILSSASVALAKPQPILGITNLHLAGSELHFQLHLVNLPQAYFYKVTIEKPGWDPMIDGDFSPLGRVSKGISGEIIRDISSLGYVGRHYDVQVELFNRKQVSFGSTPIATYTCMFTVTFHETNNLEGASIQLYSDPARTIPKGSALTTDISGNATINLEDGYMYWYTATKIGCATLAGDISVNWAPLTESFTMVPVYTVTFNETASLADVYIEIYNDEDYFMGDVTTNATGQATIDLPNDTYYYYTDKSGYYGYEGDFTVSDSAITESFALDLIPTYAVSFNEGNSLLNVTITVYDWDSNLVDVVTTNATGQVTINLLNGDYFYYATMSGYVEFDGGFTVPGSGPTISFTMIPGYTVTFDEANDLPYVYIRIYDSSEELVADFETDASGNATITLANDAYEFYAYKYECYDFDGNFTVSSEPLTVPFEVTPWPTVTFNETNGLSDVWIRVYADSALTDYLDDFGTDEYGHATLGIEEAGTYYYEGIRYPYGNLVGDFTISDSDITESFTMNTGYTVGFQEANSIVVLLQLYSDSGLTTAASSPFATNEYGCASIDLADGIYYYRATKFAFDDCTGNFTVLGAGVPVDFEMVPLTGLIFAEDFMGIDSGGLPVGWTTNASSLCYVTNYNRAGGFAPELVLMWTGDQETYSDYYVATPPIDATNTSTALNLSFKSYFDLFGDYPGHPYTYAVQTSDDDGATWTTVLEQSPTLAEYPDGYIGPETVNIDLSDYIGLTIKICWRLYGYTYWMDYWYIDDVLVTGS